MYWTCSHQPCQSDYSQKPIACVFCGGNVFHLTPSSKKGQVYGSDAFRPKDRVLPQIQRASELEFMVNPHKIKWGGFDELQLPIHARITIEGLPGSLKSTCARRCALSLANKGIPVLLVSTEEGLDSSTFQLGLQRAKDLLGLYQMPSQLSVVYAKYMEDLIEYMDIWNKSQGIVVVDSITLLNPNRAYIEDLLETSKQGFIFVEHLTTGKLPVGGFRLSYLTDVRITTFKKGNGYRARIEKNRFGELTEFNIGEALQSAGQKESNVIPFPNCKKEEL